MARSSLRSGQRLAVHRGADRDDPARHRGRAQYSSGELHFHGPHLSRSGGEIYHFAYDPDLRWSYFSGMTRDEVLLLKVFDSADDRAKWTAHSAFVNPDAPPDAPPRESIEVRTLLSFAP